MAIIQACDRCLTPCGDLHRPVPGLELCKPCSESFEHWKATAKKPPRYSKKLEPLPNGRPPVRKHYDEAVAICRDYGHVTARMYAARSGLPYRAAYYALRNLCKADRIEQMSGGVYRVPVVRAEAAE